MCIYNLTLFYGLSVDVEIFDCIHMLKFDCFHPVVYM